MSACAIYPDEQLPGRFIVAWVRGGNKWTYSLSNIKKAVHFACSLMAPLEPRAEYVDHEDLNPDLTLPPSTFQPTRKNP